MWAGWGVVISCWLARSGGVAACCCSLALLVAAAMTAVAARRMAAAMRRAGATAEVRGSNAVAQPAVVGVAARARLTASLERLLMLMLTGCLVLPLMGGAWIS